MAQEIVTKTSGRDLKFPSFYDNKVSTRTYVLSTNLLLDIDNVFEKLPITEYIIMNKKRGRRKKVEIKDPNLGIKSGSIITIKYKNKDDVNMLRGVQIKKKSNKNFRNSLTVIMIVDDKKINFKVSTNGRIQMTGCKSKEQAIKTIQFFWRYIKDDKSIYSFREGEHFEIILIPSMRNIDFNLGFNIDRDALSRAICEMPEEEYRSMLEPSFGYTGVNIKFLLQEDIVFLDIDKLTFHEDEMKTEIISYSDYLDTLSEKERNKKLEKPRYNTFLCFHSGKIIMSGLTEELMEATYYVFLDIIRDNYHKIKEKLIE